MDKKQVQSLSKAGTVTVQTEGTGHMLPRHVHLLTSSEVRQVYVSQGAREQAALGIRSQLQLPTSKSRVSGWVTVLSRDKQNRGVEHCSHLGKAGWNVRWLRLLP